jgi:hypothetical protein
MAKARRQSLAVQALQVEAIKNTKTNIKLLIKFNMSIKRNSHHHIYKKTCCHMTTTRPRIVGKAWRHTICSGQILTAS